VPDSNLADAAVLTSTFYNTYIREQVVVTCTSGTRPTGVDGRIIFETDTEKVMIYDGSTTTWNVLGSSRWVTYTPSWTNLTVGDGTQEAEYRYVVGGIRLRGGITLGASSSISGTISQTLPNSETAKSTGNGSMGIARYNDSGTRIFAGWVDIADSGTTLNFGHTESGNSGLVNATNPYTFTTSDAIYWDVVVAL
jgi:hypothetical protein